MIFWIFLQRWQWIGLLMTGRERTAHLSAGYVWFLDGAVLSAVPRARLPVSDTSDAAGADSFRRLCVGHRLRRGFFEVGAGAPAAGKAVGRVFRRARMTAVHRVSVW